MDGALVGGIEVDALEESRLRARAYGELSERERARLASMHDEAADRTLLGRHLLRTLVQELGPSGAGARPTADGCAETDEAIEVTARCGRCGNEHGRPTLPGRDLVASIAHSGPLVVAAVAPTFRASALGIDTEPWGTGLVQSSMLPDWVRHEALAKAAGTGIVAPLPLQAASWALHEIPTPNACTWLALAPPPRVSAGRGAARIRHRSSRPSDPRSEPPPAPA